MTTYNAKDLIEQAAMLADLQNSDFISWKENMMFLDNAWADLYQQIINHGDKTFLVTFEMDGDRVTLPDDFYQLQYICYSNGINSIPINRKAKTGNENGPYYDIVGNELIIYNKLNSYRKVEVSYYPTRESITFASDDHAIEPISADIIDVAGQKVYFGTTVKDVVNDTAETVSTGGFMLTDSGVIRDTSKPYFKMDNRAYCSSYVDGTLNIYKSNGTTLWKKIEGLTSNPNFPLPMINAITNDGIYFFSNGELKFFDFVTKTTETFATDLISTKVYSFNGNVYYETTEGIWCNNEIVIPSNEYTTFNGVMKVDLKTGYGILVDGSVIKSAFPNTELDFPNNVYFNYMAYQLAVYYKVKQGGDATVLAATAQDALKTFYDTLPRDTNEYVRIANVYAR